MDINVNMTVSVPSSPWCGSCFRQEKDNRNMLYCSLFNIFLSLKKDKVLKCRACYMALYDQIEKGE